MSSMSEGLLKEPLVTGHVTIRQVTEEICRPLKARPGKAWWACFGLAITS